MIIGFQPLALCDDIKTVREFLEKNYSAENTATEEETIKLAIKVVLFWNHLIKKVFFPNPL